MSPTRQDRIGPWRLIFTKCQTKAVLHDGSEKPVWLLKLPPDGRRKRRLLSAQLATKTGSQYKVMFESKAGQKIGNTQVSLPSLAWTMAAAEGGTDETSFLINGTDSSNRFETIAFRNVLVGQTVKFDLILDGYNWQADDSDSLDLIWKMTNATDDELSDNPATRRFLEDTE